jgi:hypothetical protein
MSAPRPRGGTGQSHILIGGPGRSGTTVLVQYLTVLGFDTGYTVEQALARVDPISRGGLEHSLGRGNLPYVAKSPWFSNRLGEVLDAGEIAVDWLVLPIRELYAAAQSRRRVSQLAEEAGKDGSKHPGGVSFGAKANPDRQELRLGVHLYKLVHAVAAHGIPLALLPFPEFARDHEVLWRGLEPLLTAHGVAHEESLAAYDRVFDASHISDYRPPDG